METWKNGGLAGVVCEISNSMIMIFPEVIWLMLAGGRGGGLIFWQRYARVGEKLKKEFYA